MLRLGVHEQGITEILGIAEHVVSVSAATAGVRLRPDVPMTDGAGALVTLRDAPTADGRATWDEIASWSRTALGIAQCPGVLAHVRRTSAAARGDLGEAPSGAVIR